MKPRRFSEMLLLAITIVVFLSDVNVFAMYDTGIGRFTSRDPVRGNSEEPLTLHRYLYCQNEPVNGTDPTGCSPQDAINAINAGAEMHNAALATIAYGAETGNDKFLSLGLLMQQAVSPYMNIAGAIANRVADLMSNQKALFDLAERANRLGITNEDAEEFLKWGKEYGVPKVLDHRLEKHWDWQNIKDIPHIHIHVHHIPIPPC
jgi:hypothetical protein